MPQNHNVSMGECMTKIAAQYGFGKYETIYNDGANAQFKQDNPNPDQLKPGSTLVIPDIKEKKFSGKATDQPHKFKATLPKAKLKITLKDDQGNALANKKYNLTIRSTVIEGTTDGAGLIDKDIPIDPTLAALTVWIDESTPSAPVINFALNLGCLEPHTTIKGAQQRLQNLGFDCGGITGVVDAQTKEALKAFKTKNGVTPANDTLDPAVHNKIKDVYGS